MPVPLSIEQVLALLAENPTRIGALTASLTPAQLHATPGPDEWSANDVLAHLRSCSDVWGDCMRRIIDQDAPTIRHISPRSWTKLSDYRDQDFQASFRAFAAQRAELLKFLERLAPKAWSRTATVKASGKVVTRTVLSYAEQLAVHERHHLDQFARIANTNG